MFGCKVISVARWVGLVFIIATAVAQSMPVPGSGSQDGVDRLFAEAAKDVNSGQYSAAIDKYQSILALEPNSAEALSNLGVAYHLAGRFAEAVEALQKAIQLNPALVPANLILGIDDIRLGRPRDSLDPLARVLRLDPQNRDALLAQASAYFALRDFAKTAGIYENEIAIRKDDADAWYGLGIAFEHLAEDATRKMATAGANTVYYHRLVGEYLTEQGAEIDAEEAFRRALGSAGSKDEGLHAALGFAHLRLGVVSEAEHDFRVELERHPGSREGQLGLAAVELARSEDLAALNRLCDIDRNDEDFLLSRLPSLLASVDAQAQARAVEYLRNSPSPPCPPVAAALRKEIVSPGAEGGFRHAFEAATYESARASRSVSASGHAALSGGEADTDCSGLAATLPRLSLDAAAKLAQCSFQSGRFLVSEQAAQKVVSRDPGNVAGLYWHAEASRKLAQAAFRNAVELKPESWQGHILVADIYRQQKRWPEAVANYEAAANLNPSSAAPYLGLATVHWQNGEFDQAESALHRVLQLDAENPQANFELGDIYVRRHEFEQALPYLRKRIAQGPELLMAHADLGKCLAAKGNVDDAIAELTRAEPVDRYGDIHYQLYLLYKAQGKSELARAALASSDRLRQLELQNQSAHLARARDATSEPKEGK
jgi:tetratricopeptide (TPR) repeat protein